jgi:hypothetical protein
MSLAPGELRTLAKIESELDRSDPGLVALFARFARRERRRRSLLDHLRPFGRTRGGRARMLVFVAVTATLLIACVATGVTAASRAAPSRGGHGTGTTTSRAYIPGHL